MIFRFKPLPHQLMIYSASLILSACQTQSSLPNSLASVRDESHPKYSENHTPLLPSIQQPNDALVNFTNPVKQPINRQSSTVALRFADAAQRAQAMSAKLRASQADLNAKQLQREAIDDIGLPWLFLSGTAAKYDVHGDISTASIQQRINKLGSGVDALLDNLPQIPGLPPLPDLSHAGDIVPNTISLEREATHTDLSLSAVWLAYTGGRIQAIKQYVGSRADEAQGALYSNKNALYTTLVERYFGTQLAKLAASVREQAMHTIAKHDYMAQRFLDEGLIARDKRLEATAKLAEAKDKLAAARNRSELAAAGLAQLLGGGDIRPATALFVNHNAIKPLEWYQQQALQHYPGFAQIDAKETQVEALRTFSNAAFKPSVTVLGRHEVKAHDADWLAGLNIRYTLFSGVDRQKMRDATNQQLNQIEAVREQAQSDIKLLVKKNWLNLRDALVRFDSYDQQLALAHEQAELAARSFSEGLATALDAIDADTNLAKIRTERAQAAYDYVLSLARLLESAGIAEQFIDYLIDADTHIDEASL